MATRRWHVAVIGVALAGCNQNDFLPKSFVEGMRVLGVRAEPAEVGAGETTRLEALAVDPRGAAPPIALDWAVCRLATGPGSSGTVDPECYLRDTAPFLEPVGAGESVELTVPQVSPETLGTPDFTLGVYLPVRVRARAGDEAMTAMYRLRYPLMPGLPRNHNPKIANVYVVTGEGDATVKTPIGENEVREVPMGEQIRLAASFTPESFEMFTALRGTPTMPELKQEKELPDFTWFTSAGALASDTTGDGTETKLTLVERVPAAGGTFDVWVVAHDERGGVDWARRRFTVK